MLFSHFFYFQFLSNYNGFSLSLSLHDQHFMFKDSNVFEFTNFPFKTKYNTVVYSVNSNYLFSRKIQ